MTQPIDIPHDDHKDEIAGDSEVTIASNGGLWLADDKSVKFKSWDGEQEEQLAEVLQKNKAKLEGGRVGKRASLILQHMCAEVAGQKFWEEDANGDWHEAIPFEQRELFMSQMWHVDVLTAFMLLKIDVDLDPNVKFPIFTPYDPDGERTVDWEGDLSQLPFKGSQDFEDQLWEFVPRRPFKVRGKTVTKMIMGPMKWGVTERLELLNPGAVNMKTIAASIWEIPEVAPIVEGRRLTYSTNDLKRMHKADISACVNGINEKTDGLDSSIEVYDPVVEKTFESSVPWIRADFFDVASQ